MKELIHGKPGTYTNDRCRCDECTEAWRAYSVPRVREWRKKQRTSVRSDTMGSGPGSCLTSIPGPDHRHLSGRRSNG